MSKFIIIDGNAIVHRAYHALPPLTTREGLMVNAVYGFTSMLLKVWNDLKPDYIAVTFDVAGPTFRHAKYEKYKAHRVKADQELYDQIPMVHEVVRALNLPIYEKQGYEADDVIGTIVERSKEKAMGNKLDEIYIVTGDMDTLQLITDNVKIYTLRKGMSDAVIYDKKAFEERFGFEPELMVDYKALRGDASDNIPGVPGIGEKIASELIKKFGSVEKIYGEIQNPKSKIQNSVKSSVLQKLANGKGSARMSWELSKIDRGVPDLNFNLEDCRLKGFDRDRLVGLFQKLEFASLLRRIPDGELQKLYQAGLEKKGRGKTKGEKERVFKFTQLKQADELPKLIQLIKEKKSYACRPLMRAGDALSGEFTGLVVVADDQGFFIGVELEPIKKLSSVFLEPDIELAGHNLKELAKLTTVQNRLFDVMIASYLLNPGSRAHDVGSVILKILGQELPTLIGQESLFGIDAKAAAYELFLISRTKKKLSNELSKADNLGLFQKIEMPLIVVLAEMEINGVAVDVAKLAELSSRAQKEISSISQRIYDLAGEEFNISSPVQLRDILFEKLGIPVEGVKKGKTGLSTSAEELERLRGLHPIIEDIGNYRELAKLKNTYIDVLPTLVNKKTGRVHTHFNQAVTATGRLSSSDPNLQNIPIRTEFGRAIRRAFVAEEGNVLVSADYSQIELRIAASLAQDKKMVEIFEKDEDIHRATAAAIHGVPLPKVTPEMRRAAKEINFGVLYGMGAYGLSWRAGISREQAKDFIDRYFGQFNGIKKYIEETLVFTKKEGYCETLFGRRRYIPELNSPNYQLKSAAERMAINHPIQGTAADLIKMAMINISSKLKAQSSKFANEKVKLILQVHDELVLEVKTGLEAEVGKLLKETMENVTALRVPIKVEVNWGKSWGEIK